MAKLTDAAIATYARVAGFTGTGLVNAIAIALAESKGDTLAQHGNTNKLGQVTSVDRGLWQINSYWHREVSDSCAYDPSCAAQATYRISRGGQKWAEWATFVNGSYKSYLGRAQAAAAAGQASSGGSNGSSGSSGSSGSASAATLSFTLPNAAGGSAAATQQVSVVELGGAQNSDLFYPFRWLLSLVVIFGFIYLISRTRAGYAAVYYAQMLILFFLFVTQWQFWREALSPLTSVTQPKAS